MGNGAIVVGGRGARKPSSEVGQRIYKSVMTSHHYPEAVLAAKDCHLSSSLP